jgi:uncharacterized protein YjiK
MRYLSLPSILPALFMCFCCTPKPTQPDFNSTNGLPYDLQKPALTILFDSDELKEISGIGPTEVPGQYLAIADERGAFFFVDATHHGAITQRVIFREKGDFEGAEMANNILWALKSDGKLFEVSNWNNNPPTVTEYPTPIEKKDDAEGLGYDAGRQALLIACKGNPDSPALKSIFAFNLKTKQLDPKPLYTMDPFEVNKLVPYNETEKHDFFSPSGVAVHPLTGDVYVVSAALKRLVVLEKNSGKIRYANRLDKTILPQPEGISFDKEGNLLISSEGKKGAGILMKFIYMP